MLPDNPADERRLVEVIARDLSRATTPAVFQGRAVIRFQEISGAAGAVFFAPEAHSGAYIAGARSGPDPHVEPGPRFERRGPLLKWLRVNEEPLVMAHHADVVAYLPEEERHGLTSLSAAACVPLVNGSVLGFVVLSDRGNRLRLSQAVVRLLAACARQLAILFKSVTQSYQERQRLEAASRSQQMAITGQIASSVAHEVRNPLATIRSSVQYVLDSPAEWSRKSELLRHVIGEVDRINGTLTGVLGAARRQDLELADLQVRELVDTALALFRPYFDHHHLTLERLDATETLRIRGDATQLRQVLLNVLLNACQATPDGGRIWIASSVQRAAGRPSHLDLQICDSGCGMTPQQMARLCEPLFTTKPNGTGLGLSICQDILKNHHGGITFDSEPGKGTTVHLMLPLLES